MTGQIGHLGARIRTLDVEYGQHKAKIRDLEMEKDNLD